MSDNPSSSSSLLNEEETLVPLRDDNAKRSRHNSDDAETVSSAPPRIEVQEVNSSMLREVHADSNNNAAADDDNDGEDADGADDDDDDDDDISVPLRTVCKDTEECCNKNQKTKHQFPPHGPGLGTPALKLLQSAWLNGCP